MSERPILVLRLSAPLQAWGGRSEYNKRATDDRPTKSGLVGMLAAAQGRRRGDDIADLIRLSFGVRVDQPGTILRDYHTVSTVTGLPLPSAKVNAKGIQHLTSPKKFTHLTERFYLQDAVFTAFVEGGREILEGLVEAIRHPRFPLFLGRRSCPPDQPLIVPTDEGGDLHDGPMENLMKSLPWQAGISGRRAVDTATVSLAATIDDPEGNDIASDVPTSFAHRDRAFTSRSVRHLWIQIPSGIDDPKSPNESHDPFALLGW